MRSNADRALRAQPSLMRSIPSRKDGLPIIRPSFWLDATDERALTCDDEFLLGDQYLVAPVVTPDVTRRDIYLPQGKWQNYWTNEVFTGNMTFDRYPVPLDSLPIFKNLSC